MRCADCGLVFTHPQPAREDREEQYGADYYQEGAPDKAGVDYFAFESCWVDDSARKLALIERYARPGRLLDVGAAVGFFLREARRRGWEVHGVELSPWAAEVARERFGLDVLTADLEHADLEEASFDAVTLWHVLEHLPSPAQALAKVRRLLRSGGVLALEVPNVDCAAARRDLATWQHTSPAEHLFYFAPATFRRMLERAGFTVELLRRSGGTGLLKKGSGVPAGLQGFVARHYRLLRRLKPLVKLFVRREEYLLAIARKESDDAETQA